MHMQFEVPTALDYFASLVDSDSDFALFEAAVSLAQDEYPDLDVQAVLHEMDQLQARLRRRVDVYKRQALSKAASSATRLRNLFARSSV